MRVGKLFAVIHHADRESACMRCLRHRHGDVPAAEQIERGLRQNRLHEDLQRAAANQAIVVAGLVIQVEGHFPRRFFLHHFFRCGPDFGFDAAAADGSRDRAVFAHQHARTFVTRDRPVGVHNRSHCRALPLAPQSHDFLEEVHSPAGLGATFRSPSSSSPYFEPTARRRRCQRLDKKKCQELSGEGKFPGFGTPFDKIGLP